MQKAILLILLSLVFLQAKDTYMIVNANNQKFSFKVSLANFGFFKYGHKTTGRLHIGANYTNWGDGVDKDRIPLNATGEQRTQVPVNFDIFGNETSGCKNYQQFNEQYIQEYGNPIYIVDRGNCTFVRKASVAAKYGKMLIIIDSSDQEDVNEVIMGDDLSGEKVMIPVVMISKKDGKVIKELINTELKSTDNNEDLQVWISITFNKPYQNEKSEIQYWMIPSERESYVFLKNHTYFLTYLRESNKITFEPHFILFSCDDNCKKGYENKPGEVDKFCIHNGNYCHPDPDNSGPLTGVDSLNQAITEICIQKHFPEYFLSYFTGFHECYIKHSKKFIECGKQAFQYVAKDHAAAEIDSFEYRVNECSKKERKEPNLIEKEKKLYDGQGLRYYPALFVNGDLYRGDLLIQEAAEEFICESIEDVKDIEVCLPYADIKDDEDKFNNKFISSESSNLIYIVCGVLFAVFLIGLFIYRRKIKLEVQKELTMQVDAAIQQYYALNENK